MKKLIVVESNDIIKLGKANKGFKIERAFDNRHLRPGEVNREHVFYKAWKKENKHNPHINFGHGILQDIFGIRPTVWYHNSYFKLIINWRDNYIAATLIQWLGTNCGWAFLCECIRKCGYDVVKREEK